MFTVSCPSCAATYQLDEAKVGPAGRKLKCAKCGHIWVAMAPGAAAEAAPAVETPAPKVEAAAEVEPSPAQVQEEVRIEESEPVAEMAMPAVDRLAQVGRYPLLAYVTGERKWVALAAAICVLGALGGAWVMLGGGHEGEERLDIKKLAANLTSSREVIAAPDGVVLKDLKADFVTDERDGVMFSVSGRVVNGGSATVVLPKLEVELVNAEGQVTDVWPAKVETTTLAPTGESAWVVTFSNPELSGMAGWRAVFVK